MSDCVQAFHLGTIPGCKFCDELTGEGVLALKLAHKGHDIEARATVFQRREWGVEVTVEWLDGAVENKKKFGLPYGIFASQNDAESWGLLAAIRWIDAGKPDSEPFMTAH